MRFIDRWRAWGAALKYALLFARSARVRCELILELQVHDSEMELDELRCALPGWHVAWSESDRVRCTPPAFGSGQR
jgi:hypothetical protein